MSNDTADRQRQKINEFLQLLPVTIEIAGLTHAEAGKYFNEGILEIRANNLRNAFKFARQLKADPDIAKLLQLLPIAIELAGLPKAEPGKHFNEGQMEVRANALRNAFKAAHQLALGIARTESEQASGSGG